MNVKICIILVNYNGFSDTVDCIKSIEESSFKDYKVIVVDNGSKSYPKSEELFFLKNKSDYLETGVNLGFAGGNNYGAKYATEKYSPEFLLFLNNDTVIDNECLFQLIQGFTVSEEIGLVTGKIFYFDEPQIIWSAGGQLDLNRIETPLIGNNQKDCDQYNESGYIDFATGCVWLIPTKIYFQLGMMTEKLFLYYEDTEFCIRLKQYGYGIYYVSKALIYHKESRSTKKGSWLYQYYNQRNYLYMVKNYGTCKSFAYFERVKKCLIELLRGRRDFSATVVGTLDFIKGKFGEKGDK